MRIAYLDGPRLRRSLMAGCDHVETQRRELNRINVFPVPDGDTGTNLALTVRAIRDHLVRDRSSGAGGVAREAAEAAVLGARGNSGMMLAHFLLGFADDVEALVRIDPARCARAMSAGIRSLDQAIDHPVEGTILTVVRETAQAARESAERDFVPFLEALLGQARASLARTPELLPVLKAAGVVDAGAKGFVHLLEGISEFVARGDPRVDAGEVRERMAVVVGAGEAEGTSGTAPFEGASPASRATYESAGERYRFCTEALVRSPGAEDVLPDQEEVRRVLRERGDSLVVVRSARVLKVHIHTDDPAGVFRYLGTLGELATHKAEDMRAQHRAASRRGDEHGLARRPVALVTESAHDLPEAVIRAHGIRVVPLLLLEGDQVHRDGVDITASEFHDRMDGGGELPTTSQPAPADFLAAFHRAAEEGEEILYVGLSAALSGTFASAEAAAGRFDGAPVHRFDSRAASILQGLLVLKAAELAELGMAPDRIVAELERTRDRSGLLFTVDRFDRLLASGRVSWGRAWLGGLLNIKPILGLTAEGRIELVGKARGRQRLLPAVLDRVVQRVPSGGAPVRFGVVHVGCPEVVDQVKQELRGRYGDIEILDGPATPVLATHLGPGAWGLAYMVEDERGTGYEAGDPSTPDREE